MYSTLMSNHLALTETNAIDVLRDETQKRAKANRVLAWIVGSVLTIMALMLIRSMARREDIDLLMYMGILVPITTGVTIGLAPRHKAAAEIAARISGPEVLGLLIDTLDTYDSQMKSLVIDILKAGVAVPATENVRRLEPSQTKKLLWLAAETKDQATAVACLKAVSQWGDASALPTLDNLAEKGWQTMTEQERAKLQSVTKMSSADLRLSLARTRVKSASTGVGEVETVVAHGDDARVRPLQ